MDGKNKTKHLFQWQKQAFIDFEKINKATKKQKKKMHALRA